ncbi:Pycsar system effector family protein [Roseivirga sp.]|uniref:Pycsar system effector family protein n=1 Tax=Roseivirga sp. TaxID=1964215 RepID=UPI003B51FC28
MTDLLVPKVQSYCKELFSDRLSENFVYHNYHHTERVVDAARIIGRESELTDEELELVTIAAWFHDVGYTEGCDNHEETSVKIAEAYLSQEGLPEDKIRIISGCILATRMPQAPKNLLEQILCDADMHHLACTDYHKMSDRMHREIELTKNKKISESDWDKLNFSFFNDHEYFTEFGKKYLQPIKDDNLKRIGNGEVKEKKKSKSEDKQIKKLEKKLAKMEEKARIKPDRGIETMFRTTSKNHLELSAMADNKANIMISVNTIILSVVVSVLIRKLYEYPNLVIPTIVLIIVCLTTIVLAILATRPNVSSGVFTDEEVLSKRTNLLFFGNFHKMKLDRYEWGMKEMMKDGDYLYGSLIKDIYYLGVVLGKKYKLLRACYTFFMIGFVISIIAFVCAMLLFPPQEQTGFYTF